MTDAMEVDCAIFGGGAAGLWTLDELVRAGWNCFLLESQELGAGQTVASQGIIHGGLKYTLSGLLSPAAKAIAEMPGIWRRCLSGQIQPDLSGVRLRSHHCVLWQTASLRSRLGMIGARAGLRIAPQALPQDERPALLRACPGVVARLDEQVIEPWTLISALGEQHRARILKIDTRNGLEIERKSSGPDVECVRLINPQTGDALDLKPTMIVLTAGAGNAHLRRLCGLSNETMQLRPLHMPMLRGGKLPPLHGHCVDGAATRVTITSTRDFSDRFIWQVGGQVAERGVDMDSETLIRYTREELQAVLPALDLSEIEWATYRADRAEAASAGKRPADIGIERTGNVITAWPTKLALVPRLAMRVREMLGAPARHGKPLRSPQPNGWPRPMVALPPWETTETWTRLD